MWENQGFSVRSTAFRRLRHAEDRVNAGLRTTRSATAFVRWGKPLIWRDVLVKNHENR